MRAGKELLGVAAVILTGISSSATQAAPPVASRAEVALLDRVQPPVQEPELRDLWNRGAHLETQERLLESVRLYQQIASALPEQAFIHWRISRNYWRHGESLPVDSKAERRNYFQLAEQAADRALAIDPDCAECMLWKVAAMGRLATTGNPLSAARKASKIARLLERGIELQPTHWDGELNSTLGNLYYSSAAFYRIVPDWFWLKWVVGVRGDKRKALEYIKKALELTEQRIDYQVELGAILLCIGAEERDPELIRRGEEVMAYASTLDPTFSTDHRDIELAGVMVDDPAKACGFSRDGWVDRDSARSVGVAK
jgi:tetratricopeptide (TPR) repeat protein